MVRSVVSTTFYTEKKAEDAHFICFFFVLDSGIQTDQNGQFVEHMYVLTVLVQRSGTQYSCLITVAALATGHFCMSPSGMGVSVDATADWTN